MIRKIFFPYFLFILTINTFAQSNMTREEYIQKYSLLAIREMQRTGIPASITLAQACLESGNGNSELSRASNNHFGIKCKSSWNGQRVYYDDDARNECFRSYRTVEESFIDHSDFLVENQRYGDLFMLRPTDYKSWAKGLKKAGYATNPHYANQLIDIIEDYELYLYDEGLGENRIPRIVGRPTKENTSTINPYNTRAVSLRNGIKSIEVKAGDTFESIAQEFGMNTWEIYRYNDYQEGRQPIENEILYIEPKNRKGNKNQLTHVFESDDSMHYIAQRYGIKLKPLYRRNRMKQGEIPATGTVIYLRKKAPK